MRVALAQFAPVWEDKEASKERIRSLIDQPTHSQPIDWFLFPEMTLTGFSNDRTKTTLDDVDHEFFSALAKQHSAFITYGGVADGKNVSITLARDGSESARYEKIHLFSYANEEKHYNPGTGTSSLILDRLTIRPLVSYDLRFPYLFWDDAPQTDLYTVIANWPDTRAYHWRSLLVARAIENQAFVIGVNRVGRDPHVGYDGGSMVVDPMGNVLLDCGASEGMFTTEIEPDLVRSTRTKFPFLVDRKR
jgi:omega-amidase